MEVIMLSRLEEVRLGAKRKTRGGKTAMEQLRDHLYKMYPVNLLVGEEEKRDRRWWKYVASKGKKR